MIHVLGKHGFRLSRAAARLVIAACLALLCAGCGSSKPSYPSATLSGAITIADQPVPKGTILFMPLEPQRGDGTSAEIVQGKYTAKLVPQGKVLVRFNAVQETGRMITSASSDTPQPERIDLVPESKRSGLEIVVAGDDNQKNFDL